MSFHAIPSFAKSYKKEYVFLYGIDDGFGHIEKYLNKDKINKKDRRMIKRYIKIIDKCIKDYQIGIEEGILQDLKDKDVKPSVFSSMDDLYDDVVNYFYYIDSLILMGIIDKRKFGNFVAFNMDGIKIRYERGYKYGNFLNLYFIFEKLKNLIKYHKQVIKYRRAYSSSLIRYNSCSSDSSDESD